jgi:U3 small nucleolar RNA-associated protein 14
MPGRQSTGPLSTRKVKPRKQKAKRSLNALAIAEAQNPLRSKIRQGRLGQVEAEPSKRKRQNEEEDEVIEDGPERLKRRKAFEKDRYGNEIEVGSDSSGNEWTVGKVDNDDDSNLDSDEAMGESDDERFDGFAFRGSSASKSSKKRRPNAEETGEDDGDPANIDLRENGVEAGSSSDEMDSLGEDAVDLADILDASDDDRGMAQKSDGSGMSGDEEVGLEVDDQGSDQESSDEEEQGSMLSFSDDEEDLGDSKKLASLQALMSTMNEQVQGSTRARNHVDAQESTMPSDLPLSSKRKLTAADLMTSKIDPELRKTLKLLANNDAKSSGKRGGLARNNDVPLPKRQQDRLDRAAAYEKSKETLSRWIDTVKNNRRAEHLSFPLKDPNAVVSQGTQRLLPTSHTQPLTDLESTIQSILQDSGLAAPQGKSEEDQLQAFEELQTRKMPLEEVQARRAELRRARELLFREEMRQKRINKIKSKAYRKVHRKERERMAQQEKDALTAAGVDDSESEQERNDRRRAEERMGARHREGRWAKGVKDSGRAKWDEDARGGVTEMARRGEELRRRIEGKRVAGDEEEMISSESGSDGENDMRDRLQRLDGEDDELDSTTRGSRLANMDFMKKAEAARKAQNDEDLARLRREEAGEETPSEDENEEGLGRRAFGPSKNKPAISRALPLEQKSEFEERQGSDIEDGDGVAQAEQDPEIVIDTSAMQDRAHAGEKQSLADRQRQNALHVDKGLGGQASENPWLMGSNKGSNIGNKLTQTPNAGAVISNSIPMQEAAPIDEKQQSRSALRGSREAENTRQVVQRPKASQQPNAPKPKAVIPAKKDGSEDEEDDSERLPFVLRNQDLVRKAFAGDEVVADFSAEKHAAAESEDEKTISTTLPGWGAWTGAGIGKKAQKRNNKYKTVTKIPGVAKEKRQDAKLERVIINEKRVKKNGKYLASNLPHPFETRQQYERSLRLPVGPEWTTKETFQGATKPRVLVKQGVIRPMAKPMI